MIILISGKAGHGKTTFGNYLGFELQELCKTSIIINFADILKFYCKEYFHWDGKKDEVGRRILQEIGTDIVRSRNQNFWVDRVIDFIQVFYNDYDNFIIPDWRFPNEADKIRDIFGFRNLFLIRIERKDFSNSLTDEQRLHPSETALDDYTYFDYEISVNEGLENVAKGAELVADLIVQLP